MQSRKQKLEGRLGGLRSNRYSYWVHWRELAQYILPRRYKWLVTPNEAMRGSPINQHIIDSTGTIAARTLASGFMSGNSSPTRPWFKLHIEGFEDESSPVVLWLNECEKRMYRVFQESNFYNAMAVMYFDLVVFGTAPVLIYEDFDNVIHCYNPCAGEYFIDNDAKFVVTVFDREFVLTVSQIVDEFKYENCPPDIQAAWDNGGASLTREYVILHAIEPNNDGEMPEIFKFCEYYWVAGHSGDDEYLRKKGYFDNPLVCPRWDLVANDAYGRSPGMDALGDIKQLQQETKRKGQAIDKMVNPPLRADVQLKNQPASGLPGGITYVNGMTREKPGLEPIYNVMPPIAELKQDVAEIQTRIKATFFNNLFMGISDLQTVRTATEIDARREEKLVMLGPVLERLQNEGLAKVIDRVWGIMLRYRLFPPPPSQAAGMPINIEYVSMLAEAQKAVATSAIERSVQFGGGLAAVDPSIMDNFDLDETVREYNSLLSVSPKLIRSPEQIAAIRASRAKQQQVAALLEQTRAGAEGAKTLSQTDVGGGKNALETMLQ